MLDISLRLGNDSSSSQELCDYCSFPAEYLSEFGLLCGRHFGYVRILNKVRAKP